MRAVDAESIRPLGQGGSPRSTIDEQVQFIELDVYIHELPIIQAIRFIQSINVILCSDVMLYAYIDCVAFKDTGIYTYNYGGAI